MNSPARTLSHKGYGSLIIFLNWLERFIKISLFIWIMKIQKNVDQYFLTLPKKLVEAMGWNKGDKVEFKVAGKKKLELEKL